MSDTASPLPPDLAASAAEAPAAASAPKADARPDASATPPPRRA